jgi:hypothetical protein
LLPALRGQPFNGTRALPDVHEGCDLISFLDDEVELHPDYLRSGCEFMGQHPEIVAISDGGMIANGTPNGELSRSEAIRLVESIYEDSSGSLRL